MPEYTIDELAQAADVTVRNIRAYQTRDLLPTPRREGRRNVYGDAHLARLRLISSLLDRGFTLSNIGDVLEAFDRGGDMADLLGLEAAITSPWSAELPTHLSALELRAMFGGEVRPSRIRRAVQMGLLKPDGLGFQVPSPRLLHVGADLVKAGIPLDVLLDHIAELREDMERVARRYVHLIEREIFDTFGEDTLPPPEAQGRLTELIQRVRPMARTVVEVELSGALERAIRQVLGDRLERVIAARDT